MRTTLTLDPDLARELRKLAQQQNKSFKETVNSTLKAGLEARRRQVRAHGRFKVDARPCGFRPGIDTRRLNQLIDELDADEAAAKATRRLK